MSTLILPARPLTPEAFAPFGEVIQAQGESRSINAGTCQRFHDLAPVDVLAQGGRPLINIFRSQPVTLPVTLRLMERHPLSSQAFIPLDNRPWLAVVAPPGDDFQLTDLRAFVANGRQGVSYRRGVWHHPLLVLLEVSDFLVVDRGGTGDNCDERPLEGMTVRVEV